MKRGRQITNAATLLLAVALTVTACSSTGSTVTDEGSTEAVRENVDETSTTFSQASTEETEETAEEITETTEEETQPSDEDETEDSSSSTYNNEESTEETEKSEETTLETQMTTETTANMPETTKQQSETTTKVPETTKAPEVKLVSVTATVNGTHYIGDTLTGADINVTVTMTDGSKLVNPSGWSANPLTLDSASTKITVTYQGVSTVVTVNAAQRPTATPVPTQAPTPTPAPTQPQPTPTPAPTQPAVYAPAPDANGYMYELAYRMFEIQNSFRAEGGLQLDYWDDEAYAIACARAKEMAAEYYATGKCSHNSPGNLFKGRLADGSRCTYGENIVSSALSYKNIYQAMGLEDTAQYIMQAFKDSSGHYANIMDYGIGVGDPEYFAYKKRYAVVGIYCDGTNFFVSCVFRVDDIDLN